MKFAHLADCHVGSWRDPLLAELSTKTFEKAIDICIFEKVDFVIIAGDLFNTSLPAIDKLKVVAKKFKELKDSGIPIYFIAGSHDYSPSGKTMLDVLENAGLAVNVTKGKEVDGKLHLDFTVDKKTGVKLTGILGRMGGLDKNYFHNLARDHLENEKGYKIFLFHALLTELKPKKLADIESHPLSLLPKNFNYYAGGHPHFVYNEIMQGYGRVAYTGPLFPNSFSELEELHHGGFYIIEDGNVKRIDVKFHDVETLSIDAKHKSSHEVMHELLAFVEKTDVMDKIALIRISGALGTGKPSDIDFKDIYSRLKEKGAFVILKNSAALSSKEFEDVKVEISKVDEVEARLIKEMIPADATIGYDPHALAKQLLSLLDTSKKEGETVSTFEKRIKEEIEQVLR